MWNTCKLITLTDVHIRIEPNWTLGTFISVLYLSPGVNPDAGFIIVNPDKKTNIWDSRTVSIKRLENHNPTIPIRNFLLPGTDFNSRMMFIQPLRW